MKRLSYKFTSFILSFLIIFSIVFCDYKRVSAFEWAVPTVTWEIAAPFLFGLLGVTYVGSSNSFWDNTEDEFLDYAQTEGYTGPDVRQWLSDVFSGSLNQVSGVWSCFKSWVKSLVNSSTNTGVDVGDISSIVRTYLPNAGQITAPSYNFTKGMVRMTIYSGIPTYTFYLFNSDYNCYFLNDIWYGVSEVTGDTFLQSATYQNYENNFTGDVTFISYSSNSFSLSYSASSQYYVWGFDNVSGLSNVDVISGTSSDIPLESLDGVNISDLDLINSGAVSTSIPDVISLPWQNVGETTQDISQTIDGLIDAVNEGVLDLSDLVTTIQGLLDVITIDTTNDIVIPETVNPDTGENTTPEDVVQDNISNSAFILKGLEKVFPFCLPYDLYNFVTLLVAEPEAPEIHFPIYDPTSGETLTIDIDFEDWEPIVILFRYIFDFLFIIGLILIARALVGGGDKA